MKMEVVMTVLRAGQLSEDIIGHEQITGRSVREAELKITRWARKKFGRMDNGNWRMKIDAGLLVPCYAVESATGNTIHLR